MAARCRCIPAYTMPVNAMTNQGLGHHTKAKPNAPAAITSVLKALSIGANDSHIVATNTKAATLLSMGTPNPGCAQPAATHQDKSPATPNQNQIGRAPWRERGAAPNRHGS